MSTSTALSIWIGSTPPSLNRIAGRRWDFVREKRRWQTDLGLLLMAEATPRGLARVEASAVLTFPTKRRRDEGNFRTLLEKALGDALVEGGWLPDDTPDRFTFGAVTFATGAARTTLELRVYATPNVRPRLASFPLANDPNAPNAAEGR